MKRTAIAALLLAAATAPGLCAGYDDLNAAISYRSEGRNDDAIIWFTKALDDGDLIPDQKRIAYLDRGLVYAAKDDVKAALADYSAAIAAQPENLLAYQLRAATFTVLKDYEKAYVDYGTLFKLRPHDYSTRMIFGWMSWQMGQYQAAADAFYYFANTKTEAWLWLQLANVRLSKPVDDLGNIAVSWKSNGLMAAVKMWPNPMARFFKGDISEDDAIHAAPDNDVCDANIYAGLWHLVHKERPQAETLLNTAEAKCRETGEYWRIAHTELAKMDGAAK